MIKLCTLPFSLKIFHGPYSMTVKYTHSLLFFMMYGCRQFKIYINIMEERCRENTFLKGGDSWVHPCTNEQRLHIH